MRRFFALFQLAYNGSIPINLAKLFLESSEKSRNYLEKYYNLKTKLYLDYTHLVCRTALPMQGQSQI